MINPDTVFSFNPVFRIQFEAAQNSHVLLYPEGMVKLSDSASAILTLIDGQKSVEDICEHLQQQFPEAEDIKNDILEFLGIANAQNWILHNGL